MRLALGTAQFGLPYGVANAAGQVPPSEVRAILDLARQRGVDTVDTAMAYGDSEAVLGQAGVGDFKVITKLPAVPEGVESVQTWVLGQVRDALQRLRLKRLHAVLLHRPAQLLEPWGAQLAQAMRHLQHLGWVERIGVSIYAPQELAPLLPVWTPDLVQLPLNLLDRRLVESGCLQRWHEHGIAVHVRSVFLQGLLLMPRDSRPEKFAPWQSLWARWHAWLDAHPEHSAQSVCLAYALSHPHVERVVVGVDNLGQFGQLLSCALQAVPGDWPQVSCEDLRLIQPSNWPML